MQFSVFLAQRKDILEGFRPLACITKQSRRVIDRCHPNSVFIHPSAMLSCNTIIRADNAHSSNSSQAYNDLWLYQCHLIAQIGDARLLLLFFGISVSSRSSLDNITDIAVLSTQIHDGQHIIQKLPRRPNKGFSLQIFLLPRSFSHKHHICRSGTDSKNHIASGFT